MVAAHEAKRSPARNAAADSNAAAAIPRAAGALIGPLARAAP